MTTVPFTVTALRFRRDDGGADYAQTLMFSDVELWLGSAAFDYPEADFASNHSGDETLMFDGTLQRNAVAGMPASIAPSTADLFEPWLEQRARAKQPKKDLPIHMWTCPGATLDLHPMPREALGMTRMARAGRALL